MIGGENVFSTEQPMRFNLSDRKVQELGSLLYKVFKKLMGTPRTVAAFNMAQILPKAIRVRVIAATENRFRIEEIIHRAKGSGDDVWNDPRIVGILSSIGSRSVDQCVSFDMAPEIKRWFWAGTCLVSREEKKAGNIHPTKVINKGFKLWPLRRAKLPIFALYSGGRRRVLCEWTIEIPFVLYADQQTYIPGKPRAVGKVIRVGDEDFQGTDTIITDVILNGTDK